MAILVKRSKFKKQFCIMGLRGRNVMFTNVDIGSQGVEWSVWTHLKLYPTEALALSVSVGFPYRPWKLYLGLQ